MDKDKVIDIIDRFRIIPRIIIVLYSYIFYNTAQWFMLLEDPSTSQAMFMSTIVGASAAFFGLYVGSGSKKTS